MVFDNFEQRVYDTQPQTCRKTKRWCVVINRHRFSKPSVLQHKLHEPTVKKLEVFTWWSLFLIEIAVLSRESSPVWRKNNSRSINWRVLPMMNKYNDLSSRSSAIPVFGWPWLVSLLIFCFVTIKCRGHIFFFKEKKKIRTCTHCIHHHLTASLSDSNAWIHAGLLNIHVHKVQAKGENHTIQLILFNSQLTTTKLVIMGVQSFVQSKSTFLNFHVNISQCKVRFKWMLAH